MGGKKYTFNEKYFDVIDSEDKAYWIGFLWGDCYNNINRRDFKLALSSKDIVHLEKFKQVLQSTHPIKEYKTNSKFTKSGKEARFYICNYHFSYILENKYGIKPNRTDFSLIKNNVPINYYKDVVRGLIDSDGTISFNKNKNPQECTIGLIASKDVLDFVIDFFIKNNIISNYPKYNKRHKNRDGNMINFYITGNLVTLKILILLYQGTDFYLDRKQESLKKLLIILKNYYIYSPIIEKGKGIATFKKYKEIFKKMCERGF